MAPQVIVINATMARRFWPNQDPIGKRIALGGDEGDWSSVIGLVADVRISQLNEAPQPTVYLPYGSNSRCPS